MTRFRPSMESLDARALPSAVFAAPPDATAGLYAESAQPADAADDSVAKVTYQDFNFTAKVSKSSPILH